MADATRSEMPRHKFPPQLHVFVRDWLSANNIVLRSRDGNVLIDTGYVRHCPLTVALLKSARGLGTEPLSWIINTHCHADHIGGNAEIARIYECPIAVPHGEAPLVERWDGKALLYDYCDQSAERFSVDAAIVPGSTRVWGDLEWQALAAPGHATGGLVFYNPEHRILISGDALWEHGFGFVMPPEVDPAALPAARATLDMLGEIDVRVVIPGHGEPFSDVAAALDRARSRVAAFEQDSLRIARHVLKVNFAFVLLDRQSMALAELPDYFARIGLYRDFNAMFFRLAPDKLAELIVGELERSGAVKREHGSVIPVAATAG
jgi:glyoxylase-like metal-dependent hydrolase (beta-lactamase superfamily II)